MRNKPDTWSRALLFGRRPIGLHALIASAGVSLESTPTYRWEGDQRGRTPLALFQQTLAGRGYVERDGRHRPVGAGQTLLLTMPEPHAYGVAPGDSWHFQWVLLYGSEAVRLVQAVVDRQGPVLPWSPDHPVGRAGADLLAWLRNEADPDPFGVSARSYAFATTLARHGLAGVDVPTSRDPGTEAAYRLARRQFTGPLTVDRLAREAGLSRFQLTRRFMNRYGETPGGLLRRLQLQNATDLLLQTDQPIAAIAEASGFADANYFARVFRQQTGWTPTAFRRRGAG
ncbi:MAG: AraC family transcriptional regulator [Opitutales bacterium]